MMLAVPSKASLSSLRKTPQNGTTYDVQDRKNQNTIRRSEYFPKIVLIARHSLCILGYWVLWSQPFCTRTMIRAGPWRPLNSSWSQCLTGPWTATSSAPYETCRMKKKIIQMLAGKTERILKMSKLYSLFQSSVSSNLSPARNSITPL